MEALGLSLKGSVTLTSPFNYIKEFPDHLRRQTCWYITEADATSTLPHLRPILRQMPLSSNSPLPDRCSPSPSSSYFTSKIWSLASSLPLQCHCLHLNHIRFTSPGRCRVWETPKVERSPPSIFAHASPFSYMSLLQNTLYGFTPVYACQPACQPEVIVMVHPQHHW